MKKVDKELDVAIAASIEPALKKCGYVLVRI